MSDDAHQIAGHLGQALMEYLFDRPSWKWRIGGETYMLADEDQYKELGEDAGAQDAPLIWVRESDGACFEIDVDVSAARTTAQAREQLRQRHARARAAWQRHTQAAQQRGGVGA